MRPRVPKRSLAAAFLLCSAACATRREGPLPTLEDYSDGVSTFADEFLEDWRAGRASARFYSADFEWRGALPGDAMSGVETRAGLELSVYPGSGPVAGSELPRGGAELRERLSRIRSAFASLGRTENVLFDFR